MKNSYRFVFFLNGGITTVSIEAKDFVKAINNFYKQFPNAELVEIKRTFKIK